MYKLGIITSSDKGYSGERKDESGLVIAHIAKEKGFKVEKYIVLPDEREMLRDEMINMADNLGIRKDTLIVNMPGSPKACREVMDYILDDLKHGIDILKGDARECARK